MWWIASSRARNRTQMSWSCVEAPQSLQEGNEQAAVQRGLPVKSKALMGRVKHWRVLKHWNSVCLSIGTALHWWGEEAERSCGSLPALSVSPFCDVWLCCSVAQSGQVSSRVPFPPRCVYRTGQLACGLAWLWEAAGSRVSLPSGLAKLRQCLAPQPQSLVRKKLKATQFWLISLCRPLTPPVTNPFIIALF